VIPTYRQPVIHIDITNACDLTCSNCTRFIGHHRKPYMMELDFVEKALKSLHDFPNIVGIMGGEPTLHPEFEEICRLVQKHVPREKRGLWTDGAKWDKYKQIISETFPEENTVYNSHTDSEVGEHQPLLIAAKDIVEDRELMWRLIGNCWIQWRWAAAITPKGGFFCEVAASQDMLLDGPGGYDIVPGWWKKNPNEFQDQVKRYCENCSAAIPMKGVSSHAKWDTISKSNAKRLEEIGSHRYKDGHFKMADFKLTEEEINQVVEEGWEPWSHRPYKQNVPDKRFV
jgi:hypothetical protein